MKKNRPPCPECGSKKILSYSYKWLCKDCGRSWVKVSHPRKKPDYSTRPPCPHCGAMQSNIHAGNKYHCGNCGRYFIYHPEKTVSHDPFIPSKEVIDIR